HDAYVLANVARFAIRRIVLRFAAARVRMRPLPQTGIDETSTLLFVPCMHRRVPRGLNMRTLRMPGKCAERYRRIRRAERRGADFGNGNAKLFAQDREPDDIARLALVGAHAERCVALQVLDRLV